MLTMNEGPELAVLSDVVSRLEVEYFMSTSVLSPHKLTKTH